jgi:hypothetical protein
MLVCNAYSQEERTYGLRIGLDVSRIPNWFLDPKMKSLECSFDIEALHNVYPTLELGLGSLDIRKENYQYYSDNTYFRVGADYNFLDPDPSDRYGMAFIGIRYAHSSLNYHAANIIIPDNYWGGLTTAIDDRNISTHWIELTAGMKAEIFHNFFMGWSLRGRFMLSKTKDEIMDPYKIPGYGKGHSSSILGFNYSLYYKIPVLKKKS